MSPTIPTHVAQAHAASLDAWRLADELYDGIGFFDHTLYIEALFAAVYLEDLYTLRYIRWQRAGGQSDWSPLDRYQL